MSQKFSSLPYGYMLTYLKLYVYINIYNIFMTY